MGKNIKNWLRGASSSLELWPDTSSRMKEEFLHRTDSEALSRDWQRIGNDIKTAIGKYEHGKTAT